MKIWTEAYRPFILGGDVNAPVCCELEPASAPIDLGKGYKGFVIVSPSDKTFVVEAITGAIIGATLSDVRADIASGDEAVMREQIEAAKVRLESAEPVTQQEFWRLLRAA